jgi:hypothetical protein
MSLLMVVAFLGFGVSLVLAGSKAASPGAGEVTLCHSGNGKNFSAITVSPSGAIDGHDGHPNDIIPPFVIVDQGGKTTHYPGKNLDTLYGEGYTGGEVLANGCEIPSGGITDTVETQTVTTTETIPVTVNSLTVTVSPTTVTTDVVRTFTTPVQTVTIDGDSTTVTVTGGTTTVTTPDNTVTLPPTTVTGQSYTVTQPAETVTAPGDVTTVTATGTTTVTVTTPATRFIRGGVLAARVRVALQRHRQLMRIRGKLIRLVLRRAYRSKVIVIVVRPKGCPPGTRIFNGRCAEIVHGRG